MLLRAPRIHGSWTHFTLLSVCPGLIYFLYFHFYVLFGVLLEDMVDSSLQTFFLKKKTVIWKSKHFLVLLSNNFVGFFFKVSTDSYKEIPRML